MSLQTHQNRIQGIYQQAGCAAAQPAFAVCDAEEAVRILDENHQLLQQYATEQLSYGPILAGLPVELNLPDGSRFIPDDAGHRWPQQSRKSQIPHWLENHWLAIMLTLVLLPGFVALMTFKVIPAAADAVVPMLPDSIAEQSGKQTLALLDKLYMNPSAVDLQQQEQIRQRWHQALDGLGIPREHYRLNFRSWSMGANALALPNGDVILTDSIVRLLADQPELLTAIMLHEIGHVEHQHSLQLLARSTATSILFAFMFGDIEGAGELVIGAGASLAQSAFSRDMEREADAFAYSQLHKLGQSPSDFADAMTRLMQSHGGSEQSGQEHTLSDYLSSHPAIQERIQAARDWQPEP